MKIDLDYIGNMPRSLAGKGWNVLAIKSGELRTGDLIFLGDQERSVSHVALALSEEEVFHSSWQKDGGAIEKLTDIFMNYHPLQDADSLLSYVDPRSVT